MTIPVFHDGDHGGDDFITSILFMAYPDIFELQGITTVMGNTNPHQAAINALKACDVAKRDNIPVHSGAIKPFKSKYRLGDDAFGSDGLGNVELAKPAQQPASADAVLLLAQSLRQAKVPQTICVTGPMTNVARLMADHPDVIPNIKQLVAMGGGTEPAGNIKPYAEFNFYMDPEAADLVLNSGLNIILHSLNTTQSVVYTKARQEKLQSVLQGALVPKIDAIMRITEELEQKTFGSEGSFFHDHQVCSYLAMPENYQTQYVKARVNPSYDDQPGKLIVEPADHGLVQIVTHVNNTDQVFDFVLEGLKRTLND